MWKHVLSGKGLWIVGNTLPLLYSLLLSSFAYKLPVGHEFMSVCG